MSSVACIVALIGGAFLQPQALSVKFDQRRPGFSVVGPGMEASGRLYAAFGPADRRTEIAVRRYASTGRRGSERIGKLLLEAPDGQQVECTVRTRPMGLWTAVTLSLAARGKRAFLEIGWRWAIRAEKVSYWAGGLPLSMGKIELKRTLAYPLSACWSQAWCLAVGLDPGQWISWLRNAADLDARPRRFETGVRLVIDPGKPQSLRFVVGAFQTRWGLMEALEQYYQAYERWFRPLPGTDPRLALNGGNYLLWTDRPQPDLARRLMVGWDWCYAPFRRTGDIYGRPELWDYKPARKPSPSRSLPPDEFHAWRKKRFDYGHAWDVVMAFYVPAQIWCEVQLAKQLYSDAIVDDPAVVTVFNRPWVTGHDNEVRVFPLETSFGRRSREDMKLVAQELGLRAFAFDTAGGGARYYGPAVERCPARAWDDRGVFVAEGVAVGALMDYVHSLRTGDGRPLGVVSNPGAYSSFMTVCRSDSAMLEADPLTVEDGRAQALRYRLGHKTMVFWETYEWSEILRDDLSREQYIDALWGVAEWTALACLRVAALPTPRIAMGMTPLVRWLPTLAEVALAGWQPVPAAERQDGGWVTRAGRGLGTYFATGNMTARDAVVRMTVYDRRIGPGRYLWREVGPGRDCGGPVEHKFASEATAVAVAIPARQPCVLKPVGRILRGPGQMTGKVHWREDLDEAAVTVEFSGGEGSVVLEVAAPRPDMFLTAARGATGRPRPSRSGWLVRARCPGRLALEFRSRLFGVSRSRLVEFPQRRGDKMDFVIALEGRQADLEPALGWLAEYFPYYCRSARGLKALPPDAVPVQKAGEGKAIVLRLRRGRGARVTIEGERLVIEAPTKNELKDAVKAVLRVWDERFFYPGPLPGAEMFKRTGLAWKPLPPRPGAGAGQSGQ